MGRGEDNLLPTTRKESEGVMAKRKSTMIEMVEELEKLRPLFLATGKDADDVLNFLIKEAKAGEFHDYKNQKYDCGKVQVCSFLDQLAKQCHERKFTDLAAGLSKISADVKNGEYDEEADLEDQKMLGGILSDMMGGRG